MAQRIVLLIEKGRLPLAAFTLGAVTGLTLRDQFEMPTYMRIKFALLQFYISTGQQPNFDVMDAIDPLMTTRLMRKQN